jgi:hypothetical protein
MLAISWPVLLSNFQPPVEPLAVMPRVPVVTISTVAMLLIGSAGRVAF